MKLIELIWTTNKARTRQYETRKVGALDFKYVPRSKQLYIKAQAFPIEQSRNAPYKLTMVVNGITASGEPDKKHQMPYRSREEQIDLFLSQPSVQSNMQFRCSCFTGDTLIPLADGFSVPIKDLVERDEFFTHSFDLVNNTPVIGKGHSARVTRKRAEIVELTFDNGHKIKCTSDHLFLLKSGEYKEAGKLSPEDSLMALYRDISEKSEYLGGYERVYNPLTGEADFTHHLSADSNDVYGRRGSWMSYDKGTNKIRVSDKCLDEDFTGSPVRHHVDQNKLNNSPNNIKYMKHGEHWDYHSMHMNPEVASQFERGEHLFQSDEWRERMRINNPMSRQEVVRKVVETNRQRGYYQRCHENFYDSSGEHVSTKLANEGNHHFQSDGHRKYASDRFRSLAESGEHPAQNMAADGKLFLQTEEGKRVNGERQSKLIEEGNHGFSRLSREDVLRRNGNRKGQLDRLLDWWNALPKGSFAMSFEDLDEVNNFVGYSYSSKIYENVNKISELKEGESFVTETESTGGDKVLLVNKVEDLQVNHRVVSVKPAGFEDVYDFTVDKYHNFAIDLDGGKIASSGVYVHNCLDYYFMWQYYNKKNKALIGPHKPYIRKTDHYPPRNPAQLPGLCKHQIQLVRKLMEDGILKKNVKVYQYLKRRRKPVNY